MLLQVRLEDPPFQFHQISLKDVEEQLTRSLPVFLDIANGSAFELETQLILAADLEYISLSVSENIISDIQEIEKMIYNFKIKIC